MAPILSADVGVARELPSRILPGLFLGDCDNAGSLAQLQQLQISRVVNVTTDPELGRHAGIQTLHLSVRDHVDENLGALFDSAFNFISTARSAGHRVLVHCMAGRSRSAAIIIAYLMRSRRMALNEAFFHVRGIRPAVFPNVGFWEQLMAEERKLHGTSSEIPSCYAKQFAMGLLDMQDSPARLFRKYATGYLNGGPEWGPCHAVLQEWPEGMGGGGSVESILLSSFEHLAEDARCAAVHFIKGLLVAGRLTPTEVMEGFQHLASSVDLEDLRCDIPKIDDYFVNGFSEAERQHLISPELYSYARHLVEVGGA